MRQRWISGALVAVLAAGVAACDDSKAQDPPAVVDTKCATCAEGKSGEAVWCEDCNAGYVRGKKTTCKGCFAAKQGGPACEVCAAKDR